MNKICSFVVGATSGISLAVAALILAGNNETSPSAVAGSDLARKRAAELKRVFPSEGFETDARHSETFVDGSVQGTTFAAAEWLVPEPESSLSDEFGNSTDSPGTNTIPEFQPVRIDGDSTDIGELLKSEDLATASSCPNSRGEFAMPINCLSALASSSAEKIGGLSRLASSLKQGRQGKAADRPISTPVFQKTEHRKLRAIPFTSEALNAQLRELTVRSGCADAAYLLPNGDVSESLPVRPGMVVGEFGTIERIEWSESRIGVMFENGREIVGSRVPTED